jgi:hypothetical protein
MRLFITADLHFNHPGSGPLAAAVIDEMNRAGGDALLIVGDTAAADGDDIERCLSLFNFKGPKLFLCGNHELWTRGPDSHALFTADLPRRVAALGWQWLETAPFVTPNFAIVGTVGWYDYTFASPRLAIPHRFYDAKVSPGAAEYLGRADLEPNAADVTAEARDMAARWNDGKFVKLARTDGEFLAERLAQFEANLAGVARVPQVIAATHHVPFRELLPPTRFNRYEFAKAYLGSERLGQALLRYLNVTHLFCGHSHVPARAQIAHIHATNIGSSYRQKTFESLDLPD